MCIGELGAIPLGIVFTVKLARTLVLIAPQ
jgi:hypothetical protein